MSKLTKLIYKELLFFISCLYLINRYKLYKSFNKAFIETICGGSLSE